MIDDFDRNAFDQAIGVSIDARAVIMVADKKGRECARAVRTQSNFDQIIGKNGRQTRLNAMS